LLIGSSWRKMTLTMISMRTVSKIWANPSNTTSFRPKPWKTTKSRRWQLTIVTYRVFSFQIPYSWTNFSRSTPDMNLT
jgi:hypothetical protein